MTEPSPHYIKALFLALVKVAGGGEAAGLALGVSHQRISQLTSMQSADMPTLMQVVALEAFADQPVVTSALAKLVQSAGKGADPNKEAAEVVSASARLMHLTVNGASQREILAAVAAVRSELDDVPASLAPMGA
jgi:hypothetical protein